jgi:hypothetical protein
MRLYRVHFSIYDWVKFPTFDTPRVGKPALALAPGPFFDGMLRWARGFLIGFSHFLRAVDRDLIPAEAGLTVFATRRYIL